MKPIYRLLAPAVLPLFVAVAAPGAGTAQEMAQASEAGDRVAAAQKALDEAQAALARAEETGGDIRAARRSLANAMKSLRAAENAAGTSAGPSAPETPAAAATPSPPAPPAPAAAPSIAGPQPYQPPAVRPAVPNPAPPPKAPATARPAETRPAPPAPASTPPGATPRPAVPNATQAAPAPRTQSATPQPARPSPPAAAPRGEPPPPLVIQRGSFTETTYAQPGGYRITETTDRYDRVVRRVEIAPNGTLTVLMDSGAPPARPVYSDPWRVPPPPGVMGDPDYGVPVAPPPPRSFAGSSLNGGRASEAEIERTLRAAPPGTAGGYSLDEIRRDPRIRQMARGVDLDTITFETGSARVPDDQIRQLQRIGRALGRILDRRPDQVFLIEGHTDAVGSASANLALSDRRAASVAGILNRYFGIPRMNLVAQGYGEAYLKIPTEAPERQNRRVTIRNITPLMSGR